MTDTREYTDTERIDENFPPETAEFLKNELREHAGECHYDPQLEKIVYHDGKRVMKIYNDYQCAEMEKHRWNEHQRTGHDMGPAAYDEWNTLYAPAFSKFWRATHKCIPVKEETEKRARESTLGKLCAA